MAYSDLIQGRQEALFGPLSAPHPKSFIGETFGSGLELQRSRQRRADETSGGQAVKSPYNEKSVPRRIKER